MNVLAHSFIFWLALIMALGTLYILPTLIAAIRGTESMGWIVVINLLPTGVGWPAALILALLLPRRPVQQLPVPGLYPAAGFEPETYMYDA
jgi:hypothetical protein